MQLALCARDDPDNNVWSEISDNIGSLMSLYSSQEWYRTFLENYVQRLFEPIGRQLGWDPIEGLYDNILKNNDIKHDVKLLHLMSMHHYLFSFH